MGLRACLGPLAAVRQATASLTAPLLAEARAALAELDDLKAMLEAALVDEPPLTLQDGRIIRETWSEALAALVNDAAEARRWIAGLEERERARTGLSSLRVRFNRVFGYGIEVTHAQAARAPAEYVRRQTLAGAERYVTPELKEYEAKVLGAEERGAGSSTSCSTTSAAGWRRGPPICWPPRGRWPPSMSWPGWPRSPTRAATCGPSWTTAACSTSSRDAIRCWRRAPGSRSRPTTWRSTPRRAS